MGAKWTKTEEGVIRAYAAEFPKILKALPHRTYDAIKWKAKCLGISLARRQQDRTLYTIHAISASTGVSVYRLTGAIADTGVVMQPISIIAKRSRKKRRLLGLPMETWQKLIQYLVSLKGEDTIWKRSRLKNPRRKKLSAEDAQTVFQPKYLSKEVVAPLGTLEDDDRYIFL